MQHIRQGAGFEPPSKVDIYYWPRSFVLYARGFEQSFRNKPYQRLAATVLVATQGQLEVQVEGQGRVQARAVLIGNKARRQALHLPEALACLVDVGIDHPAFPALMQRLNGSPMAVFDDARADALAALFSSHVGQPNCTQAKAGFDQAVALATAGIDAAAVSKDARVSAVLNRIDALPRDELRVAELARQVGLSESRLRTLAHRALGCSLANYLRWAAAWKTMLAWQPGLTLTQAAMEAGFHDLAHATHTFHELFGLPPSRLLDARAVNLHPCPS